MVQRILETLTIILTTREPEAYSKKRIEALIRYAEAEGFEIKIRRGVRAK